jgi:Flp pilus assembly protein TadG
MNRTLTPLRKAKGSVLVLTAISLIAILGIAGLAIDLGFSFSNKTRLQNSVDAAALSAAMKLLQDLQANIGSNTSITTANANAAGAATHQANLTSFGSSWLTSPAAIEFCWSRNLQNFNGCKSIESFSPKDPTDPNITTFFVRARVANTALKNFLIQVIPGVGPTRSVGAVAVAGTLGTGYDCNVAPFFVCDNSADPNNPDTDCSDGACFGNPVTTNPSAPPVSSHYFRIDNGAQALPATTGCNTKTTNCLWVEDKTSFNGTATDFFVIKTASGQWNFNNNITLKGNGLLLNLLDVNGKQQGAKNVEQNIINSANACVNTASMDTQPGNVSALDAAFNTLFGNPKPPFTNQADIQSYYDYDTFDPSSFRYYSLDYANNGYTQSNTRYHQRLRSVPVIKCNSTMNGNETNLKVNGYACFFLPRQMYQKNDPNNFTDKNEDFIIAEHIDNTLCPPVLGSPGGTPNNILKAKIVLFESYETADS